VSARAQNPPSATAPSLHFGAFLLDRRAGQLRRGGRAITLRPKTWAVLVYLAEHPGVLVERDELLDAVWSGVAVTPDTLTKSIGELRLALDDDSRAPRYIETVHRRGFRFLAQVRAGEEAAGGAGPSTRGEPVAGRALRERAGEVPFVGREAELARLEAMLARAAAGERQIAFVTGAAGLGKTALIDVFLRRHAFDDGLVLARGASVEQHGPREPYMPVLCALERAARSPGGEGLVRDLRRVAATWAAQMTGLAAGDGESVAPVVQGERMLRELAALTESSDEARVLVLVLEDLHWSDPSTVDLLAFLGERPEAARLLIVASYRPAEVAVADHPLAHTVRNLRLHRRCEILPLHELSEREVCRYLEDRLPGAPFVAALGRALHDYTGGNPLFVVAVVDHLFATGALLETDPGWALTVDPSTADLGVPEDARYLIDAQLASLPPADRHLLAVASVVGREFELAPVAAALECGVAEVELRCAAMARSGRVLRLARRAGSDGAESFTFAHDLYRRTAYDEIPSARRARLHCRIGEALEAASGDAGAELAPLLAEHFARGGDFERALGYRLRSALRARQIGAHREAIAHLESALALLPRVPAGEARERRELEVRLRLAPVLAARHGFAAAEVRANAERASVLCARVGSRAQLFELHFGLLHLHAVRADMAEASEAEAELRRLAEELGGEYRRLADSASVRVAVHRGELARAAEVAERVGLPGAVEVGGVEVYGVDARVGSANHLAYALWLMGEFERSRRVLAASVAASAASGSPMTIASTQWFAALLALFAGDAAAGSALAERAEALAREHDLAQWLGFSMALQGRAAALGGDPGGGLARIEEALARLRAGSVRLLRPTFLGFVAEARIALAEPAAALATVEEGLAVVASSGDRHFEAELLRIRGEALRQAGRAHADAAEASFRGALAIARRQGARWLELRAAAGLAGALAALRRVRQAERVLSPVCRAFPAAETCADLAAARQMLAGLASAA